MKFSTKWLVVASLVTSVGALSSVAALPKRNTGKPSWRKSQRLIKKAKLAAATRREQAARDMTTSPGLAAQLEMLDVVGAVTDPESRAMLTRLVTGAQRSPRRPGFVLEASYAPVAVVRDGQQIEALVADEQDTFQVEGWLREPNLMFVSDVKGNRGKLSDAKRASVMYRALHAIAVEHPEVDSVTIELGYPGQDLARSLVSNQRLPKDALEIPDLAAAHAAGFSVVADSAGDADFEFDVTLTRASVDPTRIALARDKRLQSDAQRMQNERTALAAKGWRLAGYRFTANQAALVTFEPGAKTSLVRAVVSLPRQSALVKSDQLSVQGFWDNDILHLDGALNLQGGFGLDAPAYLRAQSIFALLGAAGAREGLPRPKQVRIRLAKLPSGLVTRGLLSTRAQEVPELGALAASGFSMVTEITADKTLVLSDVGSRI